MSRTAEPTVDPLTIPSTKASWARKWPLIAAAGFVAAGLLYSFLWPAIVDHKSGWFQPMDAWGTYRAAHWVAWGDVGDLYTPGTGFITFPGIAVLLAPIAFVTDHLGLSESFPRAIAHPTAWFALAPALDLIGVLPLFAFDAMGEFLGATRRMRFIGCWAQAVVLFPLVVVWGHPEDAVALGLATYGLIAIWKKRWAPGGWLFGMALLFQPVVVLLFPVALAFYPTTRKRLGYLIRSALPSTVLLIIPFLQSWGNTTYALVKQPTCPTVNHPTPLVFLAPVLGTYRGVSEPVMVHIGGIDRFTSKVLGGSGKVVEPGPARLIALGFAVLIGLWIWKRHATSAQALWFGALALGAWCCVEPVMTPYYTWPVLALCIVTAGLASPRRFLITVLAAIFVTVWTEFSFSPWIWWTPTVLMIGVALYGARPIALSSLPQSQPEAASS